MSQYCDTNKLENAWFNWLVAKGTPDLESYRETGSLWTKIIGLVEVDGVVLTKAGKNFTSPTHPIRAHCILSRYPIFFTTIGGKPQDIATMLYQDDENKIQQKLTQIPNNDTDAKPIPKETVLKHLKEDGYYQELKTNYYWDEMLKDINMMCMGISTKFHQKTEEEQIDLSNEALLQVMNKLVSNRLVYMPGRAPVFNLLTTTIYRCMYSIMNKRKNQREGLNRLLQDASSGNLPQTNRSLRLQTHSKKSRL